MPSCFVQMILPNINILPAIPSTLLPSLSIVKDVSFRRPPLDYIRASEMSKYNSIAGAQEITAQHSHCCRFLRPSISKALVIHWAFTQPTSVLFC